MTTDPNINSQIVESTIPIFDPGDIEQNKCFCQAKNPPDNKRKVPHFNI